MITDRHKPLHVLVNLSMPEESACLATQNWKITSINTRGTNSQLPAESFSFHSSRERPVPNTKQIIVTERGKNSWMTRHLLLWIHPLQTASPFPQSHPLWTWLPNHLSQIAAKTVKFVKCESLEKHAPYSTRTRYMNYCRCQVAQEAQFSPLEGR